MTIQEFDSMGWGCGMTAEYHGKTYPIAGCDFEEKLVGITGVCIPDNGEIIWVRCENVSVHKSNVTVQGTRHLVEGTLQPVVGKINNIKNCITLFTALE